MFKHLFLGLLLAVGAMLFVPQQEASATTNNGLIQNIRNGNGPFVRLLNRIALRRQAIVQNRQNIQLLRQQQFLVNNHNFVRQQNVFVHNNRHNAQRFVRIVEVPNLELIVLQNQLNHLNQLNQLNQLNSCNIIRQNVGVGCVVQQRQFVQRNVGCVVQQKVCR